jgi:predicted Zn-dependent peptidase
MEINTDEINAAREAGFTDQEIKNSFADELNAAKAAGFTDQEINKQFNFQPVDDGLFKNLFDTAKKRVEERRTTREAIKTEVEAIKTEVVGEEFNGDYILEQIFGANLYNLQYRAAKGVGTPEALKNATT